MTSVCDVTITYNPSDDKITVTGAGVGDSELIIDEVYLAGNGSGNWLNGFSWDPATLSNKMSEVSDNLFSISYADVAAGDYEFKFTINGSWNDNFGMREFVKNLFFDLFASFFK